MKVGKNQKLSQDPHKHLRWRPLDVCVGSSFASKTVIQSFVALSPITEVSQTVDGKENETYPI